MKKNRLFLLALCAALVLGLLAGCGGASSGSGADRAMVADEAPMAEAVEEVYSYDTGNTLTGSGAQTALPEGRKWIVTVNMSAETEDLDAASAALDGLIAQLGGYVEDQTVYNGSRYSGSRYRSASMTIRIPAEDVAAFTQEVAGLANVVSQQTSREDITLTYVDTQARVEALETEQDRLLELMAQAETMADLLEIEGRLTEVRYELESAASQLRLYDNQVDYATIYLNLEEVREYTPVEEPTFWQRLSTGFVSSVKGLWRSLLNLAVFLVAASPYLLVYGGLVLALVLLIRRLRKNRKGKKPPKAPWTQPPAPKE